MKKFFVIALAAMSMTLVSCKKSVEDQAKAYAAQAVEILKNGSDMDKMKALESEFEAWANGLSEEDQKKVEEIMEAEMKKAMPEMFESHESVEDAPVEEPIETVEETADSTATAE